MSCRSIHLPSLLEREMFNFDATGSSTTVINDGKYRWQAYEPLILMVIM